MRIAFLVDNVLRDMLGLVMVAHDLCQPGTECYLVPAEEKRDELMALEPDLVVVFNARKSLDWFMRDLLKVGMSLVLLDAEGGVWPDVKEYSGLLTSDRAILDGLWRICLWGGEMANHLRDGGYFRESQIRVTGCPRFDIYAKRWRKLAQKEAVRTLPRILLNTNTPELNQRGTTREFVKLFFEQSYGWSAARVDDHFRTQEAAYASTLELIRNLAEDFPQCQVVVRPHPFEDIKVYEDALKGINVIVRQDGPVATEIFNAIAVVQRSCTTGIEAGMAAIPALSPLWIPTAMVMPTAEAVSVPCFSYTEMKRSLERIIEGTFSIPEGIAQELKDVLSKWFCDADGLAHERVSRTLMACLPKAKAIRKGACSSLLYGLDRKSSRLTRRIARAVRFWTGLPPQWNFREFRVCQTGGSWNGGSLSAVKSTVCEAVQTLNDLKQRNDLGEVKVGTAIAKDRYRHGFRGDSIVLYVSNSA